MFLQRIFTEFDRKVDVQNHEFGWVLFRIVFLLLNNDDKKSGGGNVMCVCLYQKSVCK